MTLDEAIEHAREVERTCEDKACAAEHAQLAEWLSLLKVYTDTHMAEEVQRARHEMHGWQLEWKREMERREEQEAENDKLRKLASDMHKAFFTLDIDHCQACPRDTVNGPCTKYLVGGSGECDFEEDMRELRIEV